MIRLSMYQALMVWSDLEACLYGKNHYGGNVAEIYAYRLLPEDPTRVYSMQGGELRKDADRDAGKLAARHLMELLEIFCERHECTASIEIGDRTFYPITFSNASGVVVPPFTHRVRIAITKERP